ncbi:MAG: alpha/beta hydrolase [Deltaproteobacteria bacterium]
MTILIREITANGWHFRCRVTAHSGGEPVILLHGFPETSHAWTEVMLELERAGYTCLAPDQRGYSPGARPLDVEDYALPRLAEDVVALADALGFERVHLVGHDWGSAVGCTVLREYAARVVSWCALSVPHVASYAAGLEHPEQREKSKYIGHLLVPGLAEQSLLKDELAVLRAEWAQHCPDKADEYANLFSQSGALTAALNWYRANFDDGARPRDFLPFDVHTPTLTLWGNRDHAVGRPAHRLERSLMKGPYRFVEWDAGHRLAHERRSDVIRELLAHFLAFPVSGAPAR